MTRIYTANGAYSHKLSRFFAAKKDIEEDGNDLLQLFNANFLCLTSSQVKPSSINGMDFPA
jgi:hypothetical protein